MPEDEGELSVACCVVVCFGVVYDEGVGVLDFSEDLVVDFDLYGDVSVGFFYFFCRYLRPFEEFDGVGVLASFYGVEVSCDG